jgi:hypothetical protein
MRNILKTMILAATLAATTVLTVSSAHAEPMNGGVMRMERGGGEGGMRHEGGWRHDGGGFGGWGGLGMASLLSGLMISHAFIEDSDTHYRKDCYYVGNCKISVYSSPDDPPVVKVEKRKRAPKPLGHVKRGGWTYYLALDRNTGEKFVQIEDANGNDVHVNGQVQYPGEAGGPTYPVR